MKTLLIAVAMLTSVVTAASIVCAHADTSTYIWLGQGQWTDENLQTAAAICDRKYGAVQNGEVTSSRYKSCMLQQHWRYQSTARETIDPDTGMNCHDAGGWSVCVPPSGTVHYQNRHGLNCTRTGIMSVCSNL